MPYVSLTQTHVICHPLTLQPLTYAITIIKVMDIYADILMDIFPIASSMD